MTDPQQQALPPLPKVGPIGYASVVDIQAYAPFLKIGPHLPGVRDAALWTTDQMRAYAAEAVARALAASAPSREVPGWISVKDRMPPDGDEVLVCVDYDDGSEPYVMVDRWVMNREDPIGMGGPTIETGFEWDNNDPLDVSHWMPLPAAPSTSGEGGKEGGDHA